MFKIYRIYNNINNKSYIGQTIQSLENRLRQHGKIGSSKSIIRAAINKYGKDNFNIELLDVCQTLEEANILEVWYGELYNSMNPNGYNLRLGGRGLCEVSEETRKKISKNRSGIPLSQKEIERRKIMWLGKKHTAKTIEKLKLIHKNNRFNDKAKQRQKISASKTYEFISPDGKLLKITNLKSYCENNNLNCQSMYALNSGKYPYPTYKGYRKNNYGTCSFSF